MLRIIEDNLRYFTTISGAFLGKAATVTQYKLSRKHAFVSLANLSDAFNRMLSEPKRKQKDARQMHQFVVSNHMLTAHIATLSYYAQPLAGKYTSPDYLPVIGAISARLENAAEVLRPHTVGSPDTVRGKGADGKEGLRMLNEKVNSLVQDRKTELEQGIMDSPTRLQLSALKPIADQFNFIAKVAADIEKLSQSLNYSNPAFPEVS